MNVVITGPESCGKSTLAKQLCEYYSQVHEDEYARNFLLANSKQKYKRADLTDIARGQLKIQTQRSNNYESPVIHDTDLLTIKIWSEHVFSQLDAFIYDSWQSNLPELYLLCDYHVPWEPDPLRENQLDRSVLFEKYLKSVTDSKTAFVTLYGNKDQRFQSALLTIESLLIKTIS